MKTAETKSHRLQRKTTEPAQPAERAPPTAVRDLDTSVDRELDEKLDRDALRERLSGEEWGDE